MFFFLIDDMGYRDLGCFGAKLYETPNIDALCKAGMKFSQAYTSASICSPARATALTGIHPMKMRMWSHMHVVPKGQKILPSYLKRAGYQTWHVGKWHMGSKELGSHPEGLGFDKSIAGDTAWGPGSYLYPFGCRKDGKAKNPRSAVPRMYPLCKPGEQLTDRLTDEALKVFAKRDKTQPFYLNFWYYSVHTPHGAKAELIKKYEDKIARLGLKKTYRICPVTKRRTLTSETNATYAAMIESLDDSVGRVVATLKQAGEYDNTLFLFYSDNGPTTEKVPCAPLRGGKNTNYEAGVRVPAFAVWPGKIKGASEYKRPVYIGDVFDTFMAVAGEVPDKEHVSDSLSLLPVFAGGELPKRQFIWFYPMDREMRGHNANCAIYDEESGMKYLMSLNPKRKDELFDIHNDINETKNVISSQPAIKTRLHEQLCEFMRVYFPKQRRAPYSGYTRQRIGLSPPPKRAKKKKK